MTRVEAHDALGWLGAGAALIPGREAGVDRVAHQMAQGRIELAEDVAIHPRRFADDLQLHLFTERTGHVTHHARKSLHAVGKWPHAARQRLVIEPIREIDGATV